MDSEFTSVMTMNKYSDKSDFEINKAVAVQLDNDGKITSWAAVNGIMVGIAGEEYAKKFDPCNNPADAMPIIIDGRIAILPSSSGWMCCNGLTMITESDNLYRAAMELFLLMKEAENEKV